MRRILVCFLGGVFLLVLGAGLYGRWRQGGVNWELMTRELASLDGGWVAGAAGLAIGSYVVRALRWGVMLAAVKKQGRRFENLLAATAIGSTAVLLLGRIGELVRPYLIARKEGVPVSSQMGVWVVERVYDLLTALILLGYALGQGPVFGGVLTDGLRAGGWALAIGAGAGVAAMAGLAIWPDWAERRVTEALRVLPVGVRERVEGVVRGFLQGVGSVRSVVSQCKLFIYTVLEWALIGAGCWCFLRASQWTSDLGVRDVGIVLGVSTLGSMVQVPGIGGGVQAAATLLFTEFYGLPVEVSLVLAMTLWMLTFVVILPFGVFFGLREGVNWLTIEKGLRVGEQA